MRERFNYPTLGSRSAYEVENVGQGLRKPKAKYIEPLNPDPFDMTALNVIMTRQ